MRKNLILLSMLLIASILLMACGAEETGTPIPGTEVLPTEDELMTEEPMVTEPATEPVTEATEEGIPVTGAAPPFLLENQLGYDVWNQENEQIGEVENMVIDLGNSRISYVYIETGGFLDIGDTESLVPWNALRLAINEDPDVVSAADNVFVLQVDQSLLEESPDFELTELPATGEPADDWDAGFVDFWGGAGVEGFEPAEGAATTELQGVILATNLLDSSVIFDPDVDQADQTGVDVDGQMSVDNVIVDVDTGQVQFLVLETFFEDGIRLIPVPLSHFRWDEATQAFIFDAEADMLQNAPFFDSELTDTSQDDWQNEYFDYWR